MKKHRTYHIPHEGITFVSITMIRALSIIAVIIENYLTHLRLNTAAHGTDMVASLVAEVAGTFVHPFFVLSGYGITLSYLRKEPASWAIWTRQRFLKIVIPYWVTVTITFAFANLCHYWAPYSGQAPYSWVTLLAYLTFLRNFYSPGWILNWTLWFMPVIIGLYIIFPLLLLVMKQKGIVGLIVFSFIVTNGSVAVCIHFGYPLSHQAALPLFFLDEFALGMLLAYITNFHPERFRQLMKFRFFLLGIILYALSGVISEYKFAGHGSAYYSDILTSIGLYLIMLYVCRRISEIFPPTVLIIINKVSHCSYMMYLIHGPIIVFGLQPYLGTFFRNSLSELPIIIFSGAFVLFIYVCAEGISLVVKNFATWLQSTLPE
jgi:peptidoglycan/LPS O-acetylase OafA/YrhL